MPRPLIFICALILLLFPLSSHALTTINSSSTFPMDLTTNGETYQLSENITCPTTCFVASGDNMIIDLNGHTVTFGNSNNPGVSNTDFETWTNETTITGWTQLAGTSTRTAAIQWGNYDAVLSATASIQSPTVTLAANQTYLPYIVVKGASSDSVTVTLHKASDNSVLLTNTITDVLLDRAFAMTDGALQTTELEYKPSVATDVYLKITCSGTSTKRLFVADIPPARHYAVASYGSQNTSLFPDLAGHTFGNAENIIITGGTIAQGAGNAVKSAAMYFDWCTPTVSNITATMTGNNTAFIAQNGSALVVDNVDTDTSSKLMFNRMHPTACIDLGDVTGVTGVEIKNSTFRNDPEMVIRSYGSLNSGDGGAAAIHHNNFLNKEQSTEGYGVALSGAYGFNIYSNNFTPVRGRGILLDAVGYGNVDGTQHVTIQNNIFTVSEKQNAEYGPDSLEAVAIRVRNWGGASEEHSNLLITGNTITATTDASGVHGAYGINITASASNDDILVENNVITVSQTGQHFAAGVAFQNENTTAPGRSEIRYNTITTNDIGIKFGGNDGANSNGADIHHNVITSSGSGAIWFYEYVAGTQQNNAIYCNQISYTGTAADEYLFRVDGVLSANTIDYNLLTNGNSGGYEVMSNSDDSTGVLFFGNGTIDVYGGGSVGFPVAATNGTENCWSTAGASFSAPTGGNAILNGAGNANLTGAGSVTLQ